MEAAQFAADETGRLFAIHELKIVDTPPEARFDQVVQLASRLSGQPIAVMSVVDERRVFIKSEFGAATSGIAFGEPFRDYWFCSHVVASGAPLVVKDATKDDRFSRIALVTGDPGLVSYAGVPVRGPRGDVIGALAVFGTEAHEVSKSEVSALGDLAKLIEAELSSLPNATSDSLTKTMNFRTFERLATRFMEFGDRVSKPCVLLRVDLAGLASINHTHGFDVGDSALADAARLITEMVRGSDLVGRLGSDEFVVLLFGADAASAGLVIDRLVKRTAHHNHEAAQNYSLAFHIGGAVHEPGETGDIAGLLLTAEPRR